MMQSMVINVKMAVNLARLVLKDFYLPNLNIVRNAHRIRGKPPGVARTLQQRIEHYKNLTNDELFTTKINIGFPSLSVSKTDKLSQRIDHIKKQRKDEKLEKLARKKELLVDLEEVEKDWYENNGPSHIKRIADHYGIYEHLYNEGYFLPKVQMNVFYSSGDLVYPVYYGNVVKPSEATKTPEVSYESDKDSLWVLTLINLDGHLTEDGKEYIHWCVANIPGNNVKKGNTLVEYLQPIPPRGTGFHRYAFVLYKQDKKIDFSMKQVTSDSPLQDRTFNTRDWYQKHQDEITPAGLAFFQADWDPSLTDFFHNGLDMKEPVFEYDFPKPYMQKQRWFPSRHPFNVYMDKHRDEKQINKEYFLRILKDEHPFKGPKPALKFPMAQAFPKEMPSWLKLHEKKIRLKWGRINEVL